MLLNNLCFKKHYMKILNISMKFKYVTYQNALEISIQNEIRTLL